MPQKKSPDMAELIRGKVGLVCGDLMQLLTVMKGIPFREARSIVSRMVKAREGKGCALEDLTQAIDSRVTKESPGDISIPLLRGRPGVLRRNRPVGDAPANCRGPGLAGQPGGAVHGRYGYGKEGGANGNSHSLRPLFIIFAEATVHRPKRSNCSSGASCSSIS